MSAKQAECPTKHDGGPLKYLSSHRHSTNEMSIFALFQIYTTCMVEDVFFDQMIMILIMKSYDLTLVYSEGR